MGTVRPLSRSRTAWLNTGLSLALVGAGVGTHLSLDGSASQEVATSRTTTVTGGDVTATISISGNVESASTLDVDFPIGGELTEVKAGQTVKSGRILAGIDSTDAQEALQDAEESLEPSQKEYDDASEGRSQAEVRLDELNLDSAQDTVDSAQSAYDSAKATLSSDTAPPWGTRSAAPAAPRRAPPPRAPVLPRAAVPVAVRVHRRRPPAVRRRAAGRRGPSS